jgi:MFS family permease
MADPPRRALPLLVAGAFFMENLGGTIVATAAPAIGRSLGVQAAAAGIVMTAYLITLAALIPVSGWVCDRWGARPTFTTAVVVFTLASGLCAISTSFPELTAMRIVQGAAGALLVPVGRLVVLRSTPRADLIHTIAWLTWPALIAPVLAPVLSGFFVTYLSWHWIFLVNVPLGAVALVAALRIVPNLERRSDVRLDWIGFVVTAAALAMLIYSADLLGAQRARWLPIAALAVAGVLLSALGVRHLRHCATALVDLSALRIPTFRVPHSTGGLFRTAVFAVPFLLPLMLQEGFGWTPLRAATMVFFVFVGNLGIKPATTPILRLLGFRLTILTAAVGVGASMVATAVLLASTPLPVVAAVLLAGGAFRSIGFTAYSTLAFADVPPAELTHANTLASTLQRLAGGLGVAVGALALRLGVSLAGSSALTSYRIAFLLIAALALVAAVGSLRLPRLAGSALIVSPVT